MTMPTKPVTMAAGSYGTDRFGLVPHASRTPGKPSEHGYMRGTVLDHGGTVVRSSGSVKGGICEAPR